MNKIEIINPKISLINCIDTPPNPPGTNMLAIADSGTNTHLEKRSTTKCPLKECKKMTSRIIDGSTIESSQITTLELPGIIKQASQIYIFPKIKTTPLIQLGVLCDDVFQKNGQ